jgi:flagellar basal body-associated protein FliL
MPTQYSRRASCFACARLALTATAAAILAPTAGARAAEAAKKEFEFVPLGDFTVNLPSSGRRMAYVVVSVTLETRSEETQGFKEVSPLLRQAVLRRLMAMSERNQLRPGQTDPSLLRDSLYDSLARSARKGCATWSSRDYCTADVEAGPRSGGPAYAAYCVSRATFSMLTVLPFSSASTKLPLVSRRTSEILPALLTLPALWRTLLASSPTTRRA